MNNLINILSKRRQIQKITPTLSARTGKTGTRNENGNSRDDQKQL